MRRIAIAITIMLGCDSTGPEGPLLEQGAYSYSATLRYPLTDVPRSGVLMVGPFVSTTDSVTGSWAVERYAPEMAGRYYPALRQYTIYAEEIYPPELNNAHLATLRHTIIDADDDGHLECTGVRIWVDNILIVHQDSFSCTLTRQ